MGGGGGLFGALAGEKEMDRCCGVSGKGVSGARIVVVLNPSFLGGGGRGGRGGFAKW